VSRVIDSVDAINESTVVALARECETGSVIAHNLIEALGDDQVSELGERLAKRGLRTWPSSRGLEVEADPEREAAAREGGFPGHDEDA
jgi:hypothetical protein